MPFWIVPILAGLFVLHPGDSVLAGDVKLSSRISAVTVFPSGAEVSRVGSINVQQGEHTLIVNDLPAEAMTDSIRVTAKATGDLVLGSVDARKVFVTSAEAAGADTRRKELEDTLDLLRDRQRDLQSAKNAAETQKKLIANLAQLPTRPVPAGAAVGGTDWRQVLDVIASGSSTAQQAQSQARVQLRELNKQIKDTQKELSKLAPPKKRRTEVKIFVSASVPLEGDVTIRYQVPSASWSPHYDARLLSGDKAIKPKLDFVRRATIKQRTGEPWEQIALTLSTTRPKSGASAPKLKPMTVDYRRPPIVQPMAAPRMEMDGFADQAEETRVQRRKSRVAKQAAGGFASLTAAKPKAAKVINAPFQALYQVPGRLDIPATGEAKRVLIGQDTAEPKLIVRTIPKLAAKAYLYAKFEVPQGSPVLPGRVSLFRDGTFVGVGRMPVLASGEDHDLGFGIDDQVRVRHSVVQEKRGETGLISTSRTDNRSYKISVKNLHERPIRVEIEDQMPTSKNDEIQVVMTGNLQPTRRNVDDRQGVMAWDMGLAPGEERNFAFGYRVSWPSDQKIQYSRDR